MRAANRVGLRFDAVGDVRTWTQQQIEQAIGSTNPDESSSQLRSRLMRFVNDVGVGDLIITPNAAEHELWLATVSGSYEFDEGAVLPRARHAREVASVGWVDRDTSWIRHKLEAIDNPAAVFELRDPDWWFVQITTLDLVQDRPPRSARPSRAAPPPVAGARARKAAAPRAPRAPRVATPRASTRTTALPPKEPERFLCAGPCGLQWRAAILIDGYCPDCRSD